MFSNVDQLKESQAQAAELEEKIAVHREEIRNVTMRRLTPKQPEVDYTPAPICIDKAATLQEQSKDTQHSSPKLNNQHHHKSRPVSSQGQSSPKRATQTASAVTPNSECVQMNRKNAEMKTRCEVGRQIVEQETQNQCREHDRTVAKDEKMEKHNAHEQANGKNLPDWKKIIGTDDKFSKMLVSELNNIQTQEEMIEPRRKEIADKKR